MTKQYDLEELQRESTIGGEGTVDGTRQIPCIDLHDFESRREEIRVELWQAATEVGFFQLCNHELSSEEITAAFAQSERFFALPEQEKARWPLKAGQNAGWEFRSQVRPSTKIADEKESYQITVPKMAGLWPSDDDLPEFKQTMLSFESKAWALGMKILSCFAESLGFDRDFFTQRHDRNAADYLSTLRLLHYLPLQSAPLPGQWRAGAHSDFDCLTMVFQREGQGGLQVCPGKEVDAQAWTDVVPADDLITCNIGDMLMRWSDDQLKSTLHRVRMPRAEESYGPRYSLAFFCQANSNAEIRSPKNLYPPILASEYLRQRLAANF